MEKVRLWVFDRVKCVRAHARVCVCVCTVIWEDGALLVSLGWCTSGSELGLNVAETVCKSIKDSAASNVHEGQQKKFVNFFFFLRNWAAVTVAVVSLDWNEARRGRDSRLAASSWLFRDKGLHFCLLAGLSRISSSSPTPKLNYRERRLITDRRSEAGGRGGWALNCLYSLTAQWHYFTLCSFWFLAALSFLALIWEQLCPSSVSFFLLTITGTQADPRSAAQVAALLCC